MGEFYAGLAARLGLRLRRDDAGWESMALACAAVVEGLALRSEVPEPVAREPEPELPTRGARRTAEADDAPAEPPVDWAALRPTIGELTQGPRAGGDPQAWTTAAIAILGIIDAFTEPDPDHAAP